MSVEFGPMRTIKEAFGGLSELRTLTDSILSILAVVFCSRVSIMFDLYCWEPDVRGLVGDSIDAIFCFDGVNCFFDFSCCCV